MKRILTTIFVFLFIFEVKSQSKIYLRSGNIVNTAPEKNPNNDAAYFKDCIFDNHYFLWLQFATFPTDDIKDNLQKTGIVLYDYLPDNTFITSFPTNYNFNQLQQYGVHAVCKPMAAYKIDALLFTPNKIVWAVENDKLKVDVTFTNCVSKDYFINSLNAATTQYTIINNNFDGVVSLIATIDDIQKIATNPLVQYIEPVTQRGMIEDYQAISNHRLTSIQTTDNWSNGKKLDGTGITIAIGDDGNLGDHIDFEGRVLTNSSDVSSTINHSDHCCGIICGAGNFNPTVKGQARGALLRVYNNYDPYNLFPSLYTDDTVRVVSHSLGQTCNSGYNSNARTSDQILNSYSSLMYVHSAGNSGTTSCGGLAGFKTITGGFKAGKNVITVGNLSKSDVIDPSSSRGPLPDGRIKPEISAVGSSVNSTQPNNGFTVMSGTSMACPAVAGNVAVLMQAYKLKNNGTEAPAALLKTILMNSADDLGNTGPDFIYGYGRVNMRKAVKTVDDARYLSSTITTNVTNTHTITIPSSVSTAKVMIYWADKEATAGAAKSLVNNIDAKLLSTDNTEYLPWVIDLSAGQDVTTCSTPAVTGTDSVNNMEQIQIDNPAAGNYTLQVLGKKIASGPQKYYVVYEFTYANEIVVTHPIGGETFAPGESQRIRWDASDGISTFGVQYSLNNGTTWLTVASSVAAERRYVDWTVPSTATTAQALIKVSRGGASDISDTNFVILKVPTNIVFVDVCKTSTKLSWTAVTNATGYDVFRLGDKYMELMGSTNTNNITLENQDNGVLYYYAVRARLASKNANGRLTNAFSHANSSSVTCPLAVKLISFNASLKNNTVNLIWKVASEENMMNYVIEKSTTPNFENIEIVGQAKPTNSLFEHQYQLTDNNLKANTTFYYRLKMVEIGKILYSSVKAIKVDKWINESFAVSPNPASAFIGIVVNKLNNSNNITVNIYNEIGVAVATQNISNPTVGNRYDISTSMLASGNYFVNIIDASNKSVLFKQQVSVVK